jgi:hypothetical protein
MSLFKKWSRWLDRIENEQLRDLLINRHIFQQLQECTAPHVGTHQGVELVEWIVQNYIAFAATAIRRMMERPKKSWKSISLRILLEDLAANDALLTRQRYRSLSKNPVAQRFADRDFNKIARNKTVTHVTAARIRRDIKEIEAACASVKRLVNKVVAHTEVDRRKVGKIKLGQIDQAINLLETAFQRYSQLIHGKVCDPLVPLNDIDVRPDLKKIWP